MANAKNKSNRIADTDSGKSNFVSRKHTFASLGILCVLSVTSAPPILYNLSGNKYDVSLKQLQNFSTTAFASCSDCYVSSGKCSRILESHYKQTANRKLCAFQTTLDSIDGARRRRTLSFPLIQRSSYTTALTGKVRENDDTKEVWMFGGMMTEGGDNEKPRIVDWVHETIRRD